MPRIFISHSSGKSTVFAEKLYDWLEASPLGFSSWISTDPNHLTQGPNDHEAIVAAALRSDLCISVLAEDNLNSTWINFEAGLFYGRNNKISDGQTIRPIYTILIDDLDYKILLQNNVPLSRIYHCIAKNKKNLINLLVTLYKNHFDISTPLSTVPPAKLTAFENFVNGKETKKLLSKK